MRFCEASAKDNFNVDEIFLKLVDDILSKVSVYGFNKFFVHQNVNWNIWLKIVSFSVFENGALSWVFLAQIISWWDKRSFQDFSRHAETKFAKSLTQFLVYNGQ